jgi:hypothetical protein
MALPSFLQLLIIILAKCGNAEGQLPMEEQGEKPGIARGALGHKPCFFVSSFVRLEVAVAWYPM